MHLTLFPYVGSKSWLVPTLHDIFERLSPDLLVSPFLGSGVFEYAFARSSNVPVLGCDLNPALLCVHLAYALDPDRLASAIRALDPHLTREEYYATRTRCESVAVCADFNVAAEFVRFMSNSYSGRYGSYVNSKRSVPTRALSLPCPDVTVERRDAFELLRNPPPGRLAWYLDPPYLVRTKHYQGSTNLGFDHKGLSELLLASDYQWVLSYNDCPEIRALYASCSILEVSRRNTSLSGRGGQRTELLIMPVGVA